MAGKPAAKTAHPARKADSIPSFSDNGAGRSANRTLPDKNVAPAKSEASTALTGLGAKIADINAETDVTRKADKLGKLRSQISDCLRQAKTFSEEYNQLHKLSMRAGIAEAQALALEAKVNPSAARARKGLKSSNI